jgi:hypothetical protein
VSPAAASLVGALSLPVLTRTGAMMSETLFLAALLPLLAAAERLASRERADAPNGTAAAWYVSPLLVGLGAGALAVVRTQAVAAIAAGEIGPLIAAFRVEER